MRHLYAPQTKRFQNSSLLCIDAALLVLFTITTIAALQHLPPSTSHTSPHTRHPLRSTQWHTAEADLRFAPDADLHFRSATSSSYTYHTRILRCPLYTFPTGQGTLQTSRSRRPQPAQSLHTADPRTFLLCPHVIWNLLTATLNPPWQLGPDSVVGYTPLAAIHSPGVSFLRARAQSACMFDA